MARSDHPVSLVLADDHPLYLEGLVSVLKDEFLVMGTAGNGEELLTLLESKQPDIALIDYKMPYLDGLSAARQITILYPGIKTIILSFIYDKLVEDQFKLAGVKGYLTKDINGSVLKDKIRLVAAGATAFCRLENQTEGTYPILSQKDNAQPINLSARELEIVLLIKKGYTSVSIASSLYISVNTVEAHRKRIFRKLKIKNLQELIEFASKYYLNG